MKSLIEFYQDTDTKNNVHEYLSEFLKGEAIKKVFKREDTSGIAEAKECIDKAFENLETLFAPKSEGKEIKNEAR